MIAGAVIEAGDIRARAVRPSWLPLAACSSLAG